MTNHASDCAVHNAPALPVGPCDCPARIHPDKTQPETDGKVGQALGSSSLSEDTNRASDKPWADLERMMIAAQRRAEDGWRLMPSVPTTEMTEALERCESYCDSCHGTAFSGWSGYEAMWRAAERETLAPSTVLALIAEARDLLDACIALQMEARERGCGLRIADEAIAQATGADHG